MIFIFIILGVIGYIAGMIITGALLLPYAPPETISDGKWDESDYVFGSFFLFVWPLTLICAILYLIFTKFSVVQLSIRLGRRLRK